MININTMITIDLFDSLLLIISILFLTAWKENVRVRFPYGRDIPSHSSPAY